MGNSISFEKALLARAQPYTIAASSRVILEQEATKGCSPAIYPQPVPLEPPYRPIFSPRDILTLDYQVAPVPDEPPHDDEPVRLQVWISPNQEFDWKRSELFLKQLQSVRQRVGLEIAGNGEEIIITILTHEEDIPVVSAAFQGEFDHCELEELKKPAKRWLGSQDWSDLAFLDYYPPPPYSHLLTRPDEIHYSPYESLFTVLTTISPPAVGVYQAIFQPVHPDHNWHSNVETLLDLEFAVKLYSGLQLPQRNAQQAPSGDLRQMAGEVVSKAHPDKPFYALSIRIGLLGAGGQRISILRSLATFTNLFQHGGRPLNMLTDEDYRSVVTQADLRDLFLRARTHRHGCIVNSWELAGLVHLPPPNLINDRRIPINQMSILPVYPGVLSRGVRIGTCRRAGVSHDVCIPPEVQECHGHFIGAPGTGKSTTIENIALQDIENAYGVAVIDPHGDLIERLLQLLPERDINRTIYFNPGDRDFVPMWNPVKSVAGQDTGRTADDLVAAIRSVVTGWGDRMEHLLRHAFCALLQRPDSTLRDVASLLRFKSEEGERIRKEVLHCVEDDLVRQFWSEDYKRYRSEETTAAQHKLSKLLVSGQVTPMLSQSENRIDLKRIMDDGLVFLANLSTIGSEVREMLGCLILSQFHLTALGRSDTPVERRRPFHIICDEAARFMTEAVEDLLAETRKFGVSLTLAHQYMSQFTHTRMDALGGVGSTVIFRVDAKDARYLMKDLAGKASEEDLITLDKYQAIARIGSEVVRIETLPPRKVTDPNRAERVVQESRRRYCRPIEEVRDQIRRRYGNERRSDLSLMSASTTDGPVEEFIYDEFS